MGFLECRNLRKDYRTFSLDVSLTVKEGELLSIIGPSGSGKSTLLSLIAGIDKPDSGSIILSRQDITSLDIRKRNIGMVFQDFSLFPSMNVAKNIQYGMKDMTKAQMESRTEELLELVGLCGYGKRKVYELSGGEAQRIALARSIASHPRILLMDEPLSALDAPLRKKLRTTIREIHDATGITMLYVTHDREEAFAISDRIIIMKDGKIQAAGKPEDLYKRPENLFCAFFTGEGSSIPMGKGKSGYLFFRPEDIEIRQNPLRYEEREDLIIIHDVTVTGIEYTGSGYTVRLDHNGDTITAFSAKRPERNTVTLAIPRENVIELQG